MLTFVDYNAEKTVKTLTDKQRKIIKRFEELGEYEGIAFCPYEGFLILRLFDGSGYCFSVLHGEEKGSYRDAVSAVCEYAVKEEVGLIFTSVLPSDLGELVSCFNYSEVCARDSGRTEYTVRIKSEADMLAEDLSLEFDEISLSPISEEDICEYARLCRDESALEFWGYDYREDGENFPDIYFYNMQAAELRRGTSLSLAARIDGRFVGEVSFYAFNYRGGASVAFRLLPEYRGRGIGRLLAEALLNAAEELSLHVLYASVNKNNIPSVRLLSEYFDRDGEEGEILHFTLYGE